MSRAGGIQYLLKHGKAASPVTTRTTMPAMKMKKMARGGLSSISPYDSMTSAELAALPNAYRDAIAGHPDAGGLAYFYDPKSQRYTPAVPTATSGKATVEPLEQLRAQTGGGHGPGDGGSSNPAWDKATDEEKAAWYADHPVMGDITSWGQKLFGMTGLGALQERLNPDFVANQRLIAAGIDPAQNADAWSKINAFNASVSGPGAFTPGGVEPNVPAAGYEPYFAGNYTPEAPAPEAPSNPFSGITGYNPGGFDTPSSDTTSSWGGENFSRAQRGESSDSGGDSGGDSSNAKGGVIGMAGGGIAALAGGGTLGGYSDGGQLLRGPGDGVSDSIPAKIGGHQPARLADGEFVVPARIVSELGNGSTEAGSRKLYAMLQRIQAGRKKTMKGKDAYAKDSKADKHLPA